MTRNDDIHPFAPAGGGGPGTFVGVGPVGTNSSLDSAFKPGPLGITKTAPSRQTLRHAQNENYLSNRNVKAFLDTLAETEGGDYDLKFGGVKGKRNDKWRITNYNLPPSPGQGGRMHAIPHKSTGIIRSVSVTANNPTV